MGEQSVQVKAIRRYAELFLERLGWVLLVLVVVAVVFLFGVLLAGRGVHDLLHFSLRSGVIHG